MRYVRKLTLLAISAVAALAFMATPASATSAVEVVDERWAEHCSLLSEPGHLSGGCPVHAEGTITLERFIFAWGVEDKCDVELEMRIGGDGETAVDALEHFSAEPGTESTCASNPPVEMCEAPWEGSGERVNPTTIHATTNICIDPAEIDTCGSTIEYDLVESINEDLSVTFFGTRVGPLLTCRIFGTLSIEHTMLSSDIHIN